MRETSRSNAALASTRATRLGHLCVDEVGEDGAAGQHQPTGRALFTSPKHDIAARRIPAIAYRIEESTISPGIMAPRIVWEDTVDITADEAILRAGFGPDTTARLVRDPSPASRSRFYPLWQLQNEERKAWVDSVRGNV